VIEIVRQLGRVGLDHEMRGGGWRRVVIEKPFGRDLESARQLNHEVSKVCASRRSIASTTTWQGNGPKPAGLPFRQRHLRAGMEQELHRSRPDHVAESLGVESRGAFYEETGASRDILQNHLLQLMTLVAMEPPTSFRADALRDEKVQVLRAISTPDADSVRGNVIRASTARLGGGRTGRGLPPGTRGRRRIRDGDLRRGCFSIDDWRWSGVPFYLRAGKRLPKRATEIAIQFKDVPLRLFRESSGDPAPNVLAMRIQPDEGIMLRFAAKVPGLGLDVRTVNMDFAYDTSFVVDSPDAYETLILDALLGDASLFTRADEVERRGQW